MQHQRNEQILGFFYPNPKRILTVLESLATQLNLSLVRGLSSQLGRKGHVGKLSEIKTNPLLPEHRLRIAQINIYNLNMFPASHNSSLLLIPVGSARNLNNAAPCESTVAVIVPLGATVVVTFPSNKVSLFFNPCA